MSAQIIELKQPSKGQKSLRGGLIFPVLYRIKGYYFDIQNNSLVVSDVQSEACYSFIENNLPRIANLVAQAVNALDDPDDTKEWLIIRHHVDQRSAQGYTDACFDLHGEEISNVVHSGLFKHSTGVFTLTHKKPPEGKEGSLLIYVTKLPVTSGRATGAMLDHWTIVTSKGEVTEDFDRFYSTE
jgi:hypothetical protein